MISAVPPDRTFAGYRLLRRLGVGSRADVYLAAGSSGTVALKVFAADVSRDSVGTELDALGRHESPHLVRLLDVAGSGDELPCFVLEPVRRGSVATLLRDRRGLERGETVTLLAPIARLVTALQLAGVAHCALAPAAVHLGEGGQPVLLGLGHAKLFTAAQTPAALDDEPAARADRDALAALALTLLRQVNDVAGDPRSLELLEWIESSPHVFEFPAQLEERLFDWAEAIPILFAAASSASRPARGADPTGVPLADASGKAQDAAGWALAELIEDPLGELKRRVIPLVRGVRRRYWIAAGAVFALLLLTLTTLPAADAPPAPNVARAFGERSAEPPQPEPGAISSTVSPATPKPNNSQPSDPVDALRGLLRARARCFHDLSVLCLDGVDESDSEAFATDASAVEGIHSGDEIPPAIDGRSLSLVQRIGDSALLSLGPMSNPASVLIIRTEAGWRLRDFLSGRQATPSPAPTR